MLGQINLPKDEAQLSVPTQAPGRLSLGHAAFQARTLRKNQVVVRRKDGLGNHGLNVCAAMGGR
jgi:hypothetical protein